MQRLDRSGYELIFPVEHHRLNIDLTFATESATTSVFALDVPVRIAGPILAPRTLPALGAPDRGTVSLDRLPQPVQELAHGNPCLGSTR